MRRSHSVEIPAPANRVWEILTDVDAWPTWTGSVTSAARHDEGPLAVGSRARLAQPRLPDTDYTVTALQPGRSFTWVATAPGVRTTADHLVEDLGAASRVTLTVTQGGILGVVMGRLFFTGLTERYLAMEADGLRREAEGDPAGT